MAKCFMHAICKQYNTTRENTHAATIKLSLTAFKINVANDNLTMVESVFSLVLL